MEIPIIISIKSGIPNFSYKTCPPVDYDVAFSTTFLASWELGVLPLPWRSQPSMVVVCGFVASQWIAKGKICWRFSGTKNVFFFRKWWILWMILGSNISKFSNSCIGVEFLLDGRLHFADWSVFFIPMSRSRVVQMKSNSRWYCWWFRKPASTSWYVVYPIICRVFTSQMVQDFWTINSTSHVPSGVSIEMFCCLCCRSYGRVANVHIPNEPLTRCHKGYAFAATSGLIIKYIEIFNTYENEASGTITPCLIYPHWHFWPYHPFLWCHSSARPGGGEMMFAKLCVTVVTK